MRFSTLTLATLVLAAGVESCDTKMLDLAFDYPVTPSVYDNPIYSSPLEPLKPDQTIQYDTCTPLGYFSLEN